MVKNLISDLDLIECKEKQVDMYSGGMKRKLSAALTLIGDPKIVVLDDPTAGMDPRSRRFLWTLIKKLNETDGRLVDFAEFNIRRNGLLELILLLSLYLEKYLSSVFEAERLWNMSSRSYRMVNLDF